MGPVAGRADVKTDWISNVLRLNTRIVAAQAAISAQAFAILEMTEAGEDTTKAGERYRAYRNDLRLLRKVRDTLLDNINGDV
jgi:hypothetical protein